MTSYDWPWLSEAGRSLHGLKACLKMRQTRFGVLSGVGFFLARQQVTACRRVVEAQHFPSASGPDSFPGAITACLSRYHGEAADATGPAASSSTSQG